MMRASGFLLGALLTLAVFFLVLDGSISSPTVPAADSHETDTPPNRTAVDGDSSDHDVPLTQSSSPPQESRQPETVDNDLLLDPESWNQSMVADDPVASSDVPAVSRYRIWSPFRSQWAAQGFARRLALATDVPVEVINEEPGHYQVVFNYRTEAERLLMVEQIETVTGLELEQP